MQTPVVIVNFKTYPRGTGQQALDLAKTCASFGAWVAVQPTDIRLLAEHSGAQVWAQHVDDISFGSHTGHILPEAVQEAGATGTLINHSERRIPPEEIGRIVARCKDVGLKTCVCAESIDEAQQFLSFEPDYLAVELPELIGGDVSIMNADPGIVENAVNRLGSRVLLGAGVSTGADVQVAVQAGSAGVLLASAIVSKADDPRQALKELYSALI